MKRLLAAVALALGLSIPAYVGTAQAVECHAYRYTASNPDKGGGFCVTGGGYYVWIWCLNSNGQGVAKSGYYATNSNYSWATCDTLHPYVQTARMILL